MNYKLEAQLAEIRANPDRYVRDYSECSQDFKALLYRLSKSPNKDLLEDLRIPYKDKVLA